MLALAVFAMVTSITPGPSNLMLLASGANFGFLPTIPQVLGITLGFTSLLLGVAETLLIGFAAIPLPRDALAFIAMIVVLMWRPTGLFGARS